MVMIEITILNWSSNIFSQLYFFHPEFSVELDWRLDNQHSLFAGFILSFSISETFCHINSAGK